MPIPMSEKMKGEIYERGKDAVDEPKYRATCLTRLH